MKLYYSPGACSLSPHIILREAGLAFDVEKVDLKAKKTEKGADFTTINAKGQVPTLQLDSGEILTEGPVIVQYIADQKPGAGLAGAAGTMERYRVQEWLNHITSELHKGFSPLFRPNTPDAYKDIAKANLAAKFDGLEKHLAGRQYLMGDKFTVADAYLFTVVGWTKFVGVDLAKWPKLAAYHARVAARPKVQEALKAEGLL
ncbi:MAG: glutathione transferase GstA, partial [Alphaproteobacteria bacterium]|nr:glutathione transferase GstA [Alphaproteobacteria bacterium]